MMKEKRLQKKYLKEVREMEAVVIANQAMLDELNEISELEEEEELEQTVD